MKKPRLTTVTFADGTVDRRTSERYTYTHAVAASAEDPALVKALHETTIANAAKDIEALKAAAAAGPVIRSRGFGNSGTDMFHGKPSWVLYEAFLNYEPASRYRPSVWCNSKGITASLVPAADVLRADAEVLSRELEGDIARACQTLKSLKGGTYDFGTPKVVSWSSSEELAQRALRAAAGGYPTRVLSVVPVDSGNPMHRGAPEES